MATPPYPIRAARPDDAAIIALVHQASREALYHGHIPDELIHLLTHEERRDRWASWLEDASVLTLVGEQEGRVVGFCTLRPAVDEDLLGDPTIGEMPTLYLHPDVWRRGWGTALCDAVEARAIDRGFRTLVLWVLEMNEGARAFYRARGFAEEGAVKLDEVHGPAPLRAIRYIKRVP